MVLRQPLRHANGSLFRPDTIFRFFVSRHQRCLDWFGFGVPRHALIFHRPWWVLKSRKGMRSSRFMDDHVIKVLEELSFGLSVLALCAEHGVCK